jgi:uncharacterized protein
LRILISGASGFVGAPLSSFLVSNGHTVISLSHSHGGGSSIFWDIENKIAQVDQFEGFDIVIHLAGDPLTFSRWSDKKKEKIKKSRIEGTLFISQILSSLSSPPKVFIQASAIGIYGNRGEEILDETSSEGNGFLSSVCRNWEAASRSLEKMGVRTVKTRFGMVLGKNGGALAKLEPIYTWGLGSILGTGRQWLSWIALEDLVRAIDFIIHTNISGPVNFVAPECVRQETFSRQLAQTLRRPHFLKTPGIILRGLLGDMANELLLSSAHVTPKKLLESGFVFKYPKIQDVLQKIVK